MYSRRKFLRNGTLASVGLMLNQSAAARPSAPGPDDERVRTIELDAQAVKGPLNRFFNNCVSAGRAGEGLRAEWQRQLARARTECGFRYIRFHGLMHEDMGLYHEDREGRPSYGFQYVDQLFDALLEMGVRPFVELGLMPVALASGTKTAFWWKHNITPPKDWDRWHDLIVATVEHWVERYGLAEVRQWYFEVWNEPNLAGFWTGGLEGYLKLYAITARAVRKVDSQLRVGGPASAGNGFTKELLDYCDQHEVPLDFISNHGYGITQEPDVWGKVARFINPDPQAITAAIAETQRWIKASKHPGREFHFTEFNSSWPLWDPVRDSYYNAAWVIFKLRQVEPMVHSMSFWTLTDLYEEGGIPQTPLPGLYGMLTLHGIRKPVYFVWKWLNQLGPQELRTTDDSTWAARDESGGVQILFWNHTFPKIKEGNPTYFGRDLPAATAGTTRIQLAGLRPGNYQVAVYRVGYRCNDVYTDYVDMGRPRTFTREQIKELEARHQGAPEKLHRVSVGPEGLFTHVTPMRENEVHFVTLIPEGTRKSSHG